MGKVLYSIEVMDIGKTATHGSFLANFILLFVIWLCVPVFVCFVV